MFKVRERLPGMETNDMIKPEHIRFDHIGFLAGGSLEGLHIHFGPADNPQTLELCGDEATALRDWLDCIFILYGTSLRTGKGSHSPPRLSGLPDVP